MKTITRSEWAEARKLIKKLNMPKKKPPTEIYALGPGNCLVSAKFPFRSRELEFIGGPVSKNVPVAVVRGRLCNEVINRLKKNGYDVRAVCDDVKTAAVDVLVNERNAGAA